MARTRKRSTLTVSLFPFLSVLAAVMGTLTLIISGMSMLALGNATQIVELVKSSHGKAPVYVECREDGLILHPEGTPVPKEQIEDENGIWGQETQKIAANTKSQYVIFLVRPSGITTFKQARRMAAQQRIDIGYDPVYAIGPITFQ